ncbi:MAG: diguanylate cyclase [Hyphomicrobiaceae bacterium]
MLPSHDGLTGQHNRCVLRIRGADPQNGASEGRENATLLMIDLDHFKQVNDRFGDPEGAYLLQRSRLLSKP